MLLPPNFGRAGGRARLLVASAILGAAVAVAAVVFLTACHAVTRLALGGVAGYRPSVPAGEAELLPRVDGPELRPWLLVPVAALGGLAVGWLTSRFAPEAAGAGADAAIRAYHEPGGRVRPRMAPAKILATAATVGTGGSGGREGPMIQVGAGVGSWLAGRFGFGPTGQRVLLAAGMGAGVASVFRTPLAGALFASEVLYRSDEFEPEVLIPAGVAAVAADAVAGIALGREPLLPAPQIAFTAPQHFGAYALLAVVLVVLARAYVAAFHRTTTWFTRLPAPGALKPALGAGLAALLGVALFYAAGRDERALSVLGFGLGAVQQSLNDPKSFTIGLLVLIALGKLVTTCLTIGSGGAGGVFGPAVVIGGGGGALGLALQPLGPAWAPPPEAFVLLGMAGFFAAAAKTPFSTLVIVCEMTGAFGLLAPGLGVCIVCFVLSGKATLFDSQPASRADSPVHAPVHPPG